MCLFVSRIVAISMTLGSIVLATQPASAQDGRWYGGGSVGVSRLSPDTDGSDFTLDKRASAAFGAYIGVDIAQRLGIEAAWTQLGDAGLSDGQSVGYTALSIGGVAYLLGSADVESRQDGWSGYVRLGVSKMSNESDLVLAKENNTAIWAGAGVQWPMSPSWGLRGELASFDGDAQGAMASIYWRPGAGRVSRMVPIKAKSPGQTSTPVVVSKTPALVEATAMKPSSLSASASSCAVPADGEPLDAQGCAMFSGVQPGVEFVGDSTQLTSVAETLLERLSGSLNLYPELLLEIRVHTQSYSDPERAMKLSRARAVAVARFLVEQGVDVKRLKARAFGSTQPRANNESVDGRKLNNRVELRVL